MAQDIVKQYDILKKVFKQNSCDRAVTDCLQSIFKKSSDFLSHQGQVTLTSTIANKSYISFSKENKLSRPVNTNLLCPDNEVFDFWNEFEKFDFEGYTPHQLTKICYTIAIYFCCVIDLIKVGDQKTPGTFFEKFIGHIFSKAYNVIPQESIKVLNLDMDTELPTDFIFDLGKQKPKYHVPVKTSTRERVIQVWAHQRVLDGVYGTGRIQCLLSCIGETKLDHKRREVIEICLPDQWRLYQLHIAQLKRVYYLDLPEKYASLNPGIVVKELGDFFFELQNIQ